jgi:hypothetical protein
VYEIATHADVQGYTSEALDMNASGTIVGILHPISGSTTRAFSFGATINVLADFGYAAEARAVNASGEIVGAAEVSPGRLAAVVWDTGPGIQRLTEPAGAVTSFTHGIDDGGRIVGGCIKPGPVEVPLFWPARGAAPIEAPANHFQWAEARAIDPNDHNLTCGTSDQPTDAFTWATDTGAITSLGGQQAVAFGGSTDVILGQWHNGPAEMHSSGPPPAALDTLPGRSNGIANDANHSDEVVGDAYPAFVPEASVPFLRRSFRRDELDPNTVNWLFPKLLQLSAPETIDVNSLLPPGSGWTLTNAAAINEHGQIAGTGTLNNAARAYRLSPPPLPESPFRLVTIAEVLRIIGGVAVGGGGFGITPSGHIIPIPPPTPYEVSAKAIEGTLRKAVEEAADGLAAQLERESARERER